MQPKGTSPDLPLSHEDTAGEENYGTLSAHYSREYGGAVMSMGEPADDGVDWVDVELLEYHIRMSEKSRRS